MINVHTTTELKDTLYTLDLGETLDFDGERYVRVPKGWVYYSEIVRGGVFIPFDFEFMKEGYYEY